MLTAVDPLVRQRDHRSYWLPPWSVSYGERLPVEVEVGRCQVPQSRWGRNGSQGGRLGARCNSVDGSVCFRPSRTIATHIWQRKESERFSGGTIFVDHASGKIFVRHQVSLCAGETIVAKREFEHNAAQYGVTVKSYHSENGVFDSQEFRAEFERKGQTINFSGVGAHHQNGVAERNIRTVTEWARAMMLNASLHWPEQATLDTWPFALDYTIYLFNQMPKRDGSFSPDEIFSKTKME